MSLVFAGHRPRRVLRFYFLGFLRYLRGWGHAGQQTWGFLHYFGLQEFLLFGDWSFWLWWFCRSLSFCVRFRWFGRYYISWRLPGSNRLQSLVLVIVRQQILLLGQVCSLIVDEFDLRWVHGWHNVRRRNWKTINLRDAPRFVRFTLCKLSVLFTQLLDSVLAIIVRCFSERCQQLLIWHYCLFYWTLQVFVFYFYYFFFYRWNKTLYFRKAFTWDLGRIKCSLFLHIFSYSCWQILVQLLCPAFFLL